MPKTDLPDPNIEELERLYEDMLPHIPTAVRQACRSLRHYPDESEIEAMAQRLRFSLWENGYRRLHSFKSGAEPQPWLFKVAQRDIRRWLRGQSRMVSLEDLLPDFFAAPPDQEGELLNKERRKIMLDVVAQLTESQRKLFFLMREGRSDSELAQRLGIKVTSLRVKRSKLLSKLKEMIEADTGRA